MANIAIKRVQREFKEVIRSEELKCKVELVDNSYTRLRGEIAGPPGTPFEGGIYKLDINIPETYPFNPPKVQFVTKIWHPNISSVTGVICLDILKDQWAAAMTLRTVLLSIQALLSAAEPDDPQDAVVARQYKEHPEVYWRTAKHWAEEYAGAPSSHNVDFEQKISRLTSMGFTKRKLEIPLRPEMVRQDIQAQEVYSGAFFSLFVYYSKYCKEVSKMQSLVALSTHSWNSERAVESLLSS